MADNTAGLIDELNASFPWLKDIGISPKWLQETAAKAASSTEIVQKIRAMPQYKMRFPGLTRQDGTLRMNEAQYIEQENTYRNLLRQHGFNVDSEYRTPSTLVGFFEGEIAPQELSDRLDIYRQVQQGGKAIKDAFYVYAGLDITDDDLFEAIVDPAAEQNLKNRYNQTVAQSKPDYVALITRATQVGLANVTATLKKLQEQGAVTATAVQRLQAIDPNFAREVMSAIYTGGQIGGQAGSLNLQELLEAFEFSAIGSAAKNSGLEMPTKERLAEIRAAGVDKAKAMSAYSEFGRRSREISAAVQRARGTAFTQKQFEASQFFNDAAASRELEAGISEMEAAGRRQGSFRFDERGGRIQQRGFSDTSY